MYFIGMIVIGYADGLKTQIYWFDDECAYQKFVPPPETEIIICKRWHGKHLTKIKI